jgi:outer membrane protein assembly factor BamB
LRKKDIKQINSPKNLKAVTIALILLFASTIPIVCLPAANAHTPPWTISTYAFLVVAPNPVGVGQTLTVNFWLDKVPPTAIGGWGMDWHNITVTVTKPDGASQVLGPLNSDAVGGTWTQFVPEQVGTYTFVGHFPGQVVHLENPYPYGPTRDLDFINDTYTASTSNAVSVSVQQAQITTAYPDNPLPTGYWQNPVNSMNRNWYSIAGNWLGLGGTTFAVTGMYNSNNGNFNPYTTAPDTAHVLWTKPLAFGGQIGGESGAIDTSLYATGTAYEPKFAPVIISGILYYTSYPGPASNPGPLTAVDLHTGRTLWTVNATLPLRAGMVYNFISGDQYGAHAYLFTGAGAIPSKGFIIPFDGSYDTTKWSMYDATTGAWILNIANVNPGILVEGPNGETLSYTANANSTLTMWNASRCIAEGSTANELFLMYSAQEIWRPPQGATIDWNGGNQWTVPIAFSANTGSFPATCRVSDNVVLLTQSAPTIPGRASAGWTLEAGYSAVDGHLLWGPINRTSTPWTTVALGPAADGVYTEYCSQTMTWTAYNITTGQKLWETTPTESSWGYFAGSGIIGYGNLYTYTLGGEVYCYNLATGTEKWNWTVGSAGYDTPYGTYPFWTVDMVGAGVLADGKIYVASSHDYTPPVYKGAKLYCINATSGAELWSTLDFGGSQDNSCPVANGILVSDNCYDNQIYAFGQGQSAITVSAPDTAIPQGAPVLIKGTVTDQSPGQTCLGIPAAGTPAISDESMSAWMEYLYQQQPKPTDATGVTVYLTAVDPNGNFQDIGYAVSDDSGLYSITWTPPVPGKYVVTAEFEGSKSYYASSTKTVFVVSEATAAASVTASIQPPTQTPAPSNPTSAPAQSVSPSPLPSEAPQPATTAGTPTAVYIAIAAVAIIIVAVAAALILRRK